MCPRDFKKKLLLQKVCPRVIAMHIRFRPYPTDHDYFRFLFVLFADQITDIGNKVSV